MTYPTYITPPFMTTPKDDIQDDYYANISQTESTTGDKKVLKIKPKVVVKKPTDQVSEPVEETVSKPKIIARKIEKTETVEVADNSPVSTDTERPTARLVSREHAGEGLMRSMMKSQAAANSPLAREQDATKKPLISFQKVSTGFKPLENRPVMQLPPEERRGPRPPRPAGSSPRPFPSPAGTTAPAATGPARLRDSSKPMFQRDIGFSTPSRDGTAKK